MRPSQYRAQTTSARVARIVAALTLVLALLSGVAPPGSLAFVAPASECSMSCCAGKPTHAAGDCASVSCHVEIPGHGAANDPQAETHEDRHSDTRPSQTADADTHHGHASNALHPASHETHSGQIETHHVNARRAPGTPETDTHAAPQPEAKEPGVRRRSSIAHASAARPCPSTCGTAAGSSGNSVRQRDAAALAQVRRPRPQARASVLRYFSTLPLISRSTRRFTPPRAPPRAL